jgi:hypothetical protein
MLDRGTVKFVASPQVDLPPHLVRTFSALQVVVKKGNRVIEGIEGLCLRSLWIRHPRLSPT